MLWSLADHLNLKECDIRENAKTGMVGGFLRVANMGVWSESGGGCGAEIMAVAPPNTADSDVSVAFLKADIYFSPNNRTTLFVKAVCDQGGPSDSKICSIKQKKVKGDSSLVDFYVFECSCI